MGAVVLPGAILGDFTVVGAGAVLTKQFPEGYCVLAGNPARVVQQLDRAECVPFRNEHEYHGYIPASQFAEFRKRTLHV
jgi:carbonic anhydrase/acetyltransferase-like protein (isoleucine patch superfamily)